MGTTFTVAVGVGIVVVFSLTKLYTQVIANVRSFRMIEELVHEDLIGTVVSAPSGPRCSTSTTCRSPSTACPQQVSSLLLLSFSFIYVMSWVYVILFSEALFFVSWSAGCRPSRSTTPTTS